jgi:hypothetical protein
MSDTPTPQEAAESGLSRHALLGVCVMAFLRGKVVMKYHSTESTIRRLGRDKEAHRQDAASLLFGAGQQYDIIRVRFYNSPNSELSDQ